MNLRGHVVAFCLFLLSYCKEIRYFTCVSTILLSFDPYFLVSRFNSPDMFNASFCSNTPFSGAPHSRLQTLSENLANMSISTTTYQVDWHTPFFYGSLESYTFACSLVYSSWLGEFLISSTIVFTKCLRLAHWIV